MNKECGGVGRRAKQIFLLLLSLLITLSFSVPSFAEVLPTDTDQAGPGHYLIEVPGTFDAETKEAILAKINQIRKEACDEGVWNPSNPSQRLTPADYVPVKWSRLLEEKVRIRAVEATVGGYPLGHTRPNGTRCFTVKSSPEYPSYAENLAWNSDLHPILVGIDQWYGEKKDWVNKTQGAVTGHYTHLINPGYTVTAVAAFTLDNAPGVWTGVAQQSSGLSSNPQQTLDESKDPRTGKQTQIIEIDPQRMTETTGKDFSTPTVALEGPDKLKQGETATYTAAVQVNKYKVSGTPQIQWTWKQAGDSALASVDSSGLVTAKAKGTVTLVVTVNGVQAEKTITIISKEDVQNPPEIVCAYKDRGTISLPGSLEVTWSDGSKTQEPVTWETLPTATLENRQGSAVTVEGTIVGLNKKAVQKIRVEAAKVVAIADLTPMTIIEGIDPPLALPSTVEVTWEDGLKTAESISWTQPEPSSYAQVGTVTASGTLLKGAKTITQTINVVAKQVTQVAWAVSPSPKQYFLGDELDKTNGVLNVSYDNGKSEQKSLTAEGVAISGFDSATTGDKTLTVTYDGKSLQYTVNVKEKEVTQIAIASQPAKTTYVTGSTALDLSGGKLLLTYDNNTTETIDLTADMVTVPNMQTKGQKTVQVTYKGFTTSFTIEVVGAEITGLDNPKEISISAGSPASVLQEKLPVKVRAHWSQGLPDTEESVTWESVPASSYGEDQAGKTFTVKGSVAGTDKTALLTVKVLKPSIEAITLGALPTKKEYIEGQKLDLIGGFLNVKYDNEKTVRLDLNETMVTGFDARKIGQQDLTIRYQAFQTNYQVTVNKRKAVQLEIIEPAKKLDYIDGQTFDPAGGKLRVHFDNGETEDIKLGDAALSLTVVGQTATSVPGEEYKTEKVTASYGEPSITADFSIKVFPRKVTETSASVQQVKDLIEGDLADIRAGEYKLVKKYNDGSREETDLPQDATITYDQAANRILVHIGQASYPIESAFSFRPLAFESGEDQTYVLQSGKNVKVKTTGRLASFRELYMDGKVIDPANYVLTEGSTEAALSSAYLNTLKTGKHHLTFAYASGARITTNLTVAAQVQPKGDGNKKSGSSANGVNTGDTSRPGLTALVFVMAAGLLAVSRVWRRKEG